jgi:hypothetical protein
MTIISNPPLRILGHLLLSLPFGALGAHALWRAYRAISESIRSGAAEQAALGASWVPDWPGPAELFAQFLPGAGAVLGQLPGLLVILLFVVILGYGLSCAWQLCMLPLSVLFGTQESLPIAQRSQRVYTTRRPRQRVATLCFVLALSYRDKQHLLTIVLRDPHQAARHAYAHADRLAVRRLRFPPAVVIDWEGSRGEHGSP